MKRLFLTIALIIALAGSAWAGTITPTRTGLVATTKVLGTEGVTWTALTATDASGTAVDCRAYRTLEVQVKGTWNTGTLTIQGSDDGTNYVGLRDLSTVGAVSLTADPTYLIVLFECPAYVKPVLTGAGTDSINVTLIGRN